MARDKSSEDHNKDKRLFKKLTSKNWRQRDNVVNYFRRITKDESLPISDDEWAESFLACELSLAVPYEVRNLFEVAQGVHCYGCYFYPLFTLGSEQLYRVLEAALRHKCDQLKAPEGVNSFERMVDWLRKNDVFSEQRYLQWNAVRELRNSTTHAIQQNIMDPTGALRGLRTAEDLINELFRANEIASS